MAEIFMSGVAEDEGHTQFTIDYFGADNPRALIHLVTAPMRKTMEDPVFRDHLMMEESDLRPIANPSTVLAQLREKFWVEYAYAQENKTRMRPTHIYTGACARETFYITYVSRPTKFAWMLKPPVTYDTCVKEALALGILRMKDILALPMVKKDGEIDMKVVNTIINATKFLDSRVNGSPLQRSQIDQRSLVGHVSGKDTKQLVEGEDLEALNKKILLELKQAKKEANMLQITAEEIKSEPA